MRIAVQRLQDGRRVERGRSDADSDTPPVPGTRSLEHIRGQRQALAFRQRADRAPRKDLRRRLDVER